MEFKKVANAADVAVGTGKTVSINDKEIALFNVEGTFHAIDNTCVHRGGPLGEGMLEGNIVTCPWHGWQYDVTQGCLSHNPAVKVNSYEVKVENGEVFLST